MALRSGSFSRALTSRSSSQERMTVPSFQEVKISGTSATTSSAASNSSQPSA
ncbi:Uncharacterised protein [Mycobacteroides abscessus subsp. abscessus]|nr:Uncharacterised protein [Mycobacteroides abscessus subsp. abscessus]